MIRRPVAFHGAAGVRRVFPAWLLALLSAVLLGGCATPRPVDPLAGPALYADVVRYADFGVHRFGSAADAGTTEWLATELRQAGYETRFQPFSLPRQYTEDAASLQVDGQAMPALPLWWPPDVGDFRLRAPIAPDDASDATGRIAFVALPADASAYLSQRQRDAVNAAMQRHPAAIVMRIASPGEQPYAYNVAQADAPWPVPVLVIGSEDEPRLRAAQAAGRAVDFQLRGRYRADVPGRNVVARLDRGAAHTLVISTPTTGWFQSVCERGSGVAVFLALARQLAAQPLAVNLLFVATAGHEIGHGGMEVFLRESPPQPAASVTWLHLGASVACYAWRRDEAGRWVTERQIDERRVLFFSEALEAATTAGLGDLAPLRRLKIGEQPPPGELREIHVAGYPEFLGLASGHRFFHNPGDTPATTGPEALEPVARALARTLTLLAEPR